MNGLNERVRDNVNQTVQYWRAAQAQSEAMVDTFRTHYEQWALLNRASARELTDRVLESSTKGVENALNGNAKWAGYLGERVAQFQARFDGHDLFKSVFDRGLTYWNAQEVSEWFDSWQDLQRETLATWITQNPSEESSKASVKSDQ